MPQPVLVPLDGSSLAEQALPYAEKLTEPGCQLILLEIGQDEDDLSLLDRHADSCASLESAVEDSAEQILQVARDLGVGMIVMTSRGLGGAKRWLLGSVAEKLIRECPVPVVLVPARERNNEVPVVGEAAQLASPVLA